MVKTAQHSVYPTSGILRVFKLFARLGVVSVKVALSRPAHQRVAPTVGAPSKAWRFLQGESPC
jgi:hypothetical protein